MRLARIPPETAPVLDRVRQVDSAAAELAEHLLRSGWQVVTCWGPEQMDVWMLTLARGAWRVRFGVERGYSNGVEVWRVTESGEKDQVSCRSLGTLRELLDLIPR